MKQLTCEMCGSTDLVKDGGVFVCQTCGCKYSIEEAKKMMIEGTVDVQGTVKVDNSDLVEKYLANARRAKGKEDWEETEKYYNLVEQNDPKNIEAIFYSAYGKAMTTLVDGDLYKRQAAFKVLNNCISVIDDNYDAEKDNKDIITGMGSDLGKLVVSDFVYNLKKNGYGIVTWTDKSQTYNLFSTLVAAFTESILNIAKVDDHAYLHDTLANLYAVTLLLGSAWTDNYKKQLENGIKEQKALAKELKIKEIEKSNPELKERYDAISKEICECNDKIKELKIPYNNKLADLKKARQKTLFGFGKIDKQIEAVNTEMDNDPEIKALTKRITELESEKAEIEKQAGA